MTWTCASCSTVNADAAARCLACETARPEESIAPTHAVPVVTLDRSEASAPVAGPSPNEPRAAAAGPRAGAHSTLASSDGRDRPPGTSRTQVVVIAAVAVVAAIVGAVVVALVLGGDGGGEDASSGAVVEEQATVASTPPTTTAPTTAPTTTATTVPVGTGGLPIMPSGSWVLVLESVAHGEGRIVADQAAEPFAADGYDVAVIDTADHPAMTPGYYAVVVGRSFPTEADARSGCSLAGRSVGPSCYPRNVGSTVVP